MNKRTDLINLLAERGYTKAAAKVIIGDVFNLISDLLIAGDSVSLNGFGTFYVYDIPERQNPSVNTGKKVVVPGHKIPRFSPGRALKKAVREGIVRER